MGVLCRRILTFWMIIISRHLLLQLSSKKIFLFFMTKNEYKRKRIFARYFLFEMMEQIHSGMERCLVEEIVDPQAQSFGPIGAGNIVSRKNQKDTRLWNISLGKFDYLGQYSIFVSFYQSLHDSGFKVSRTVTVSNGDLWFIHQQYCVTVNCFEKTKMNRNRPGLGPHTYSKQFTWNYPVT